MNSFQSLMKFEKLKKETLTKNSRMIHDLLMAGLLFYIKGNEFYEVIYDTKRLNNDKLRLKFDIISLNLKKKYEAQMQDLLG